MQVNYLDFKKDYEKRKKLYLKAFDKVMKKGVYVLSDEVKEFEVGFARYLGVKHCVGVANGLEALQISLMSLEVGAGDEVITTPLSAVATTLAILAVGATPVFVDIKANGQLDESLIEKAITNKTKAVVPVHLYGQPLSIEKIKSICKKNNLFLIEDACQAHGTKSNGKIVGGYGNTSCYSFYPTKNLGAIGDGGAIATNDDKLADVLRQIRDYGQESKYKHIRYGLNSRLDELQAGILNEKLRFLENDNSVRRLIARRYTDKLKSIKGISLVLPKNFEDSNYHVFAIKTERRDELQAYLRDNGVISLVHYPITIPDQPMFEKKYNTCQLPVARSFADEVLSLPCYPLIKKSEIDYVCRIIKNFFK